MDKKAEKARIGLDHRGICETMDTKAKKQVNNSRRAVKGLLQQIHSVSGLLLEETTADIKVNEARTLSLWARQLIEETTKIDTIDWIYRKEKIGP